MLEAHLNSVGTATPPHDVHQGFVRFARGSLDEKRDRSVFDRMAGRARISHRYAVIPVDGDGSGDALDGHGIYRRGAFPSTAKRMRLYEDHALRLALAAIDALRAKTPLGQVTHLVVTSCTGFYAPGLDHALVAALELPTSVERTMVGFMGCSAAMNALKLARHIVRSEPSARVLLVNLELCSLHLQEVDTLEKMLSFLLFADGCAASLVTADPVGLALDSFRAVTLPATGDLITWHVGDSGFDMHLSGRVPGAVAAGLDSAASTILGGASASSIQRWAVHPGGRSVLEAVERGLGLNSSELGYSWDVLEKYGNMSSATISFVLEAILRDAQADERGCAMAFGPGLTAETMLFHKV